MEELVKLKTSCKKAFTLAEVLITLAIIGVVAALTIPTVVKNYQKTQVVVQLKKTLNTLSQAYNQSQAENGFYDTWGSATEMGSESYFNTYWKPYLKTLKLCTSYQDCGYEKGEPWKDFDGDYMGYAISKDVDGSFIGADGMFIGIKTTNGTSELNYITVDLNGPKGPNLAGRDFFLFERTNKGIFPRGYTGSANAINSNCSKAKSGITCAAKIARDGWEIRDDYPW